MKKHIASIWSDLITLPTLAIIASMLLVPAAGNTAEPQQTITLDQAIQRTLKQNPQLYQFTYVREGLAAERQLSALRPNYSLGFEAENFAGSGNFNSFDGAEFTVALSSIIELGDKRQSRMVVADARMDRFELRRQAETLDVLGQLTYAFINGLTTQAEHELATEAVALSESLVTTVTERVTRGAAPDAELLRAKALLAQSTMRQHNLALQLERQKVSLARYWAATTIDFSTLEGNLFRFDQELSFAELYEKVKRSPGVDILASEMRLTDAETRLAATQNSTDVTWLLGVRRFQNSSDNALVAALTVPLFNARRNNAAVKSAEARRATVDYQRQDTLVQLYDRLYTAYSLRQQYIANYEELKVSVIPNLEEALSLTRDAYDRGRLRYQDWIAAQQELLTAKGQLIASAGAALSNQTIIEQLTAESLSERSTALQD